MILVELRLNEHRHCYITVFSVDNTDCGSMLCKIFQHGDSCNIVRLSETSRGISWTGCWDLPEGFT